jgi:nitrogen fixation/metabolism regulation signal transduction histidine kinase
MTFRSKISLVIFLVCLLPTLAVLIFSTYLLSSTLNRVGNSGFENSLQAADTLVEQAEQTLGRYLLARLPDDQGIWNTQADLDEWRNVNNVDLAFRLGANDSLLSISDSLSIWKITPQNIASGPELSSLAISRLEMGDRCLLIFSKTKPAFRDGCGIIMPSGYSRRGRDLANSISAAASLGIYRTFSLKLLAVAIIVSICLALFLGLILSTSISRQLAKPLEKLTFGAKVVGAGNLDYRVSLEGDDEFSRLGSSFNTMAGEIKDNQRRLLESQRLAAWREVARRIAHEIKNPLTPIGIQLYRLREQVLALGPDEISDETLRTLETIRTQIETLGDLAQHFSTFAREPELKCIPSSLEKTIRDAADIFCKEQNLKIILNIQSNLPYLNLDPRMMHRAFVNLIKNSLEAMPAGANVDIAVKTDDGFVNVVLRDNGPGFPSEKLERIDQPYITSKNTGTGLGLVIVKKIVEEHGGQIRFYNDLGAVVEIKLPISLLRH